MKRAFISAVLPLLMIILSTSLSFAQTTTALSVLKQYVSEHKDKFGLSQKDVESLFVTYDYTDASTGIQHIYSLQKLNGLTITNSDFSLHISGDKKADANRLLSIASYKTSPVITAVDAKAAVLKLMDAISYSSPKTFDVKQPATGTDQTTIFKRNASSIWDIPARLVYYNDTRLKQLTPAWEVQMMDANKQHYWLGYIDAANGKLLEKKDLIVHCDFGSGGITDSHVSLTENGQATEAATFVETATAATASLPNNQYRVYNIPYENPIDPGASHSLVTKGGDTLASPDGWHHVANTIVYNYTHGNNVWAFQDPSPGPLGGVPSADPTRTSYPTNTLLGVPPVTEPFVFDYPIDLTKDPTTYMKAAIVNLFYWNNLMHDVFYYMGFDEAAGNFQESNMFSSGTRGNSNSKGADEVLAQAQDGGGTNNANFLTLPDGTNGQMQMYLWSAATPDSMVQIASSSTGTPTAGTKYYAVQGSLNALPTANNDLYANPVVNKLLGLAQKNALSTVGTETEGCSTAQQSIALPTGNVNGKIAVIDRGDCSFVEKVLGAQEGGAVGAIIVNNVDGPPLAMGGGDAPGNAVTIPSVMISKADGAILKAQLAAGASITGSLKRNTPPPPNRDGDIDNGVISHEYGHGISNRLTGGPLALFPLGGDEQGGEGWSDFVALYMTLRTNDLSASTSAHPNGVLPSRSIGNYVTYQAYNGQGIREYPYSTDLSINPATFAYVKRPDYSETHSVGFVWCTMLYELMQNFIDQYGMSDNVYQGSAPTSAHNPPSSAKGNNIATRLVIEGMKLQPINPTFIEERDAILKADTLLYNGQNSCLIWKAFAKRGLGVSAISGTNNLGDETEAFDVPLSCDANQKRVHITKTGAASVRNGSNIKYTIKVTNVLPNAINGLKVMDTLAQSLSYVSSTQNPTVSGKMITWTTNLAANATKTFTVTAKVNSTQVSNITYSNNQEANNSRWTVTGNAVAKWTYKTNASQAYSGSNYWFAPDSPVVANTSLRMKSLITIPSGAELVFAHKFSTELGYDGGVVEVSTDGNNWNYLPPSKFVQGNYTGIITKANNSNIGASDEAAFTGSVGDYIISVAKLDDYAGKKVYIRFRFTSDSVNNIAGGGWWIDDVYLMTNRTQVVNRATAVSVTGITPLYSEGTNAYDTTSAFIIGTASANLIAEKADKSVQLQWNTTNEGGSPVFAIQRKAAADADFVTIGTYTPTDAEVASGQYSYTDHFTATNNVEYSVKQVSDKSIAYTSNVAMIKVSNSLQATLYPNPVSTNATVQIVNKSGEEAMITLYNIHGRKLATLNGGTGNRTLALPVQGLSSSTYYVEVRTKSESLTLPMVVRK